MHGVSASFKNDALLQANSQFRSAHFFGMTSHVVTPRHDRLRGMCIFCLVSHSPSVVVISRNKSAFA